MTIQQLLDTNILEAFGLEKLPEAKKKEFMQKAVQYVLERSIERVKKELSPEKREEFFAIFKEGVSDEKRWKFLNEYVPNFEGIVLEELLDFKAQALEMAEKSNEEL